MHHISRSIFVIFGENGEFLLRHRIVRFPNTRNHHLHDHAKAVATNDANQNTSPTQWPTNDRFRFSLSRLLAVSKVKRTMHVHIANAVDA